jgi:hypothetical protein
MPVGLRHHEITIRRLSGSKTPDIFTLRRVIPFPHRRTALVQRSLML